MEPEACAGAGHRATINRTHLMSVAQCSHQAGHAVRHVAIQRKIGGEDSCCITVLEFGDERLAKPSSTINTSGL